MAVFENAEELKISKDSVSTIVNEHLGKRKICAWFVPHMLTNAQKQTQMETSGYFIDMCDQNFWKPALQEMRPGAANTIQRPSDSQWHGVHCLPRLPKNVGWQNPRLRQCWSPLSTARAWSIMNLYSRVKLSMREFWNCCCNASSSFDQNCTRVDNGISSTIEFRTHCDPRAQLSPTMQGHSSSTPSLFSRFGIGKLVFVSLP